MLKRINTDDVVLGMFIRKLEGSWFSHPFWRANFLLTDTAKLEKLRASAVPAVIIDTDRGLDLGAATKIEAPRAAAQPIRHPIDRVRVAPPAPPPPPAAPHVPAATQPRIMSAPPAELKRGFGRASAIADRGLVAVASVFQDVRLGKQIAPATVTPVINSIISSMQNNEMVFNGLMQFRRDSEQVYRHALATSALMIALGHKLHLSQIDLHAAGLAGLLLDAGVNLLPPSPDGAKIDPYRLPPAIWQTHVQLGHDFILRSKLDHSIARACLEHHERFDGDGWPNRKGGNTLSKLGRMAAICDGFDLLTTAGEGQAGLNPAEALQQMKADQGAYDPDILALFETTIGLWPTGSVVELRSGRYAVVIKQNIEAYDLPLIAVFFAPSSAQRIADVWIDLAKCYGADAIAGAASIETLPTDLREIAAAGLAEAMARVLPPKKALARAV